MESVSKKIPQSKVSLPYGTKPFAIHWISASAIVSTHLISLLVLVPWLFDWRSVAVMMITVPGFGFGINMCYHRQLAHRSFKTPRWLEHFLVGIALCCLQDTPTRWVTNHRIHHTKADLVNDPHSPLASFFWAHCGWLFVVNKDTTPLEAYQRYARDILSDPWYMRLERGYGREWIYFGHGALFFLLGYVIGALTSENPSEPMRLGLSFVVWAVSFRTVAIWHLTWSVNSVCHTFGYRNYNTSDNSRNNVFVGLLAAGEGWHNNHHADPTCATTQRRWWEIDCIYGGIWLLEKLGLAHDVVKYKRPLKI